MKKSSSISYFGYKITPHNWVETHTEYGQYDIFIKETKQSHSGFKVTKGSRECGRAKTISACKLMVVRDRKHRSVKYLNRIKVLKKMEAKLYAESRKREKSPITKIKNTAQTFFLRSRKVGHRLFNLEMGKPENYSGSTY